MRHVFSLVVLIFILALAPVISGCGKKGPPVPPPSRNTPVAAERPSTEEASTDESAPEEIAADEAIETETLSEAATEEAGEEKLEDDEMPFEAIPKELLLLDDEPEDWI